MVKPRLSNRELRRRKVTNKMRHEARVTGNKAIRRLQREALLKK